VTSTSEQLKTLLDDTAFRALESLAGADSPVSGRALARALNVAPTTALAALTLLKKAGFATSTTAGRSTLWYLDESNPTMGRWLDEARGAAATEGHERRPQLTVVIFTALGLEYAEVAAYLPARTQARVQTTRFETDVFAGDRADWTVYIAEVGPGNTRTAVEVTAAVAALQPHLVLFAGVAGSVKPHDLCRGDVIVADRVYNVHAGKDAWTEAEGSVHLTRPTSFPAAHGAVQLAMAVRRSDWVSEFVAEARNAKDETPKVEIRPIAAGELVHGDERSALLAKIRRSLNDVAAVDMESLGLYEAAHVKDLPALTVRGISDCVGDKQPEADSEWQPRAARHAAAFAFALLRHAEPEDFPRWGAKPQPAGGSTTVRSQSPAELLLRLPPPVAVAFEWALPAAGERATAVLREFAGLGGQPATWLSRFRHRPLAMFRGEGSQALWVLAAQFADSHEHPTASWLYEQAANRTDDVVLSAYLYCRGAVAASRDLDPGDPEDLLRRAEAAAPAGHLLWAYFRAAIRSDVDVPAASAASLAIADPLDLVFPRPVLHALGATLTTKEPDEVFVEFVEELAERHPVFLEQTRLTVALATASLVRAMPGQISAAQLLLEQLTVGLPAYRESHVGASTLRALAGSRSSNIPLELARTMCMRAADPSSRDMSFDRDAALARAEELAHTARDRLQDWGGPSGGALAVAAQARAASGDTRGALRLLLPPPAGTAGAAETASQPVVRVAAELAVGAGNIELALGFAARVNEPTERKLATALALTLREDSRSEAAAEYRSVLADLAASLTADQQIRALLGLSMVTELSEVELTRLRQLDAEMADLIRAQSLLTAGQISQAQILARRYPDSDGALQIRVSCLVSQGKTADAVGALENYTNRHRDERFLVQAALLALSAGANDDASRIAGRLASSNDPSRRKIAREILIDLATRHGDWENALAEAHRLISDDAVAEADPARDASLVKYRWAQAHALHQLRRMDEAYQVIRARPRLVPADRDQARLVASVLRTIAPSVTEPSHPDATADSDVTQAEVLAAVTEAAQAFPDDEELVAAAVMAAFSMPTTEPPDFALMTKARQLHQQFFDKFPDSRLIQQVPVGEALTGLKEMLRTQLAPSADAVVHMQRRAMIGQIPVSSCVSAFGRNYAEALICNKVGCYVIRYPDDHIAAQEIDAARQALNGTVVVDTSALFLAPVILGSATELQTHFERLLVAAPQRDDILQAQISLMMRSPGSLGWDPATQRPTFVENPPEVTERWATEADRLAAALRSCDVVADPPPPGDDDPRHRLWSSPIWVARERAVSLVADDAALRAIARNEGVPAFGSLQLMTALIEDGVLPASTLHDAYRRLMKIRAADLPLLGRLLEIAAGEDWRPGGYASFLLQRPATWMPIAGGWQAYTALITALPEKQPEELAGWCAAAAYGMCLVAAAPTVPAVAAALVVWTLLEGRDPAALPPLVASADDVVGQFVRGADLIEGVVQRLAMTVTQVTPPEMVGPVVLRLLSGLEGEAHANAIKHFFTMT
jgi:nucleoside phosphorylase